MNFTEAEQLLTEMKIQARRAIKRASRADLRDACKEVFTWGITHNATVSNLEWFDAQPEKDVVAMIEKGVDWLDDELGKESCLFGNEEGKLRMNSGYTKVYSLLCQQQAMYDGRVGAALGYLRLNT